MKKNPFIINKEYVYINIIFFCIIIYSLVNIFNSALIGESNDNRLVVYILIGLIITLMELYNFSSLRITNGIDYFSVLQLMLILWMIFVNLLNNVSLWNSIVHIGVALWWWVTYRFFKNIMFRKSKRATNRILKLITINYIIYFIFTVYAFINMFLIQNRPVGLNISLYILAILPLVLLMESNNLKRILITILVITVMISIKRISILVTPILLLVYFLIDRIINQRSRLSIIKLVSSIVIFLILIIIADRVLGGFISMRFESTSGRYQIFMNTISGLRNRDLSYFLLGTGSFSSVMLFGKNVHNDWFEFIFSFGLIGIVIYSSLYIYLLRNLFVLIKKRCRYASSYGVAIIYMLLVMLTEGVYFSHQTFYLMIYFGIISGMLKKEYMSDVSSKA